MKVVKVEIINNYRIYVEFGNGEKGEISFDKKVHRGVFRFLEDEKNFHNVKIDPSGDFINWSNEVEIAAEDLYEDMKAQEDSEDLFR